MFLDIRVTLATFVTAFGLALVMAAVGTRAWVGQDRLLPPQIEARAPVVANPMERGFGVSPASARVVETAPAAASLPAASVQSFLGAHQDEPARAVERVTPSAVPVAANAMPGATAVVQER